MPKKWKVLSSEVVLKNPYLTLRKDRCELPDGRIAYPYYVIEKRDVAVVFALTRKKELLLVREYKHGIGKVLLQLPAGFIEKKEPPLQAAKRELLEETGYEAKRMQEVCALVGSASDHDNRMHVFFAKNVVLKKPQQLDYTEDIEVVRVPWKSVLNMIEKGKIDTLLHVAAILLIREKYKL